MVILKGEFVDSFEKQNVWFGLVLAYGTSTIVGYLMPNPFLYI